MGEHNPHHTYRYWIALLLLANLFFVGMPVLAVRILSPVPQPNFLAPGTRCVTCWQGIAPGKTKILDVSNLLADAGLNFELPPGGSRNAIAVEAPHGWLNAYMFPSFAGFRRDPRIAMFCLRDDDETGGLILADVLGELGTPDDTHFQEVGAGEIRVYLRYRARQIEVSFLFQRPDGRFTLLNPIEAVCFEPFLSYPAPSTLDLPWRGATSLYRYYPELRAR